MLTTYLALIMYVCAVAVGLYNIWRPAPGGATLLRRMYYIVALGLIAFGTLVVVDSARQGVGGAVTGTAGVMILLGMLLICLGLCVRGARKLFSRITSGPSRCARE